MNAPIIIATRASRLALWQARHVQQRLMNLDGFRDEFGSVDLLSMSTRGDEVLDRSLDKIGGKGLFVKELEAALMEGRAHIAVHSLKDVPMHLPPGLMLVAVLEREDPRDALVSVKFRTLAELPPGARVGTSSLRRLVQLRALRPDLSIQPLRGNLDTRLRKLDTGEFDALVLAAAGLVRLNLEDRIAERLQPDQMLPCAGQGALALEVRSGAAELVQHLSKLSHHATWLSVHAERAVSEALGGSCSTPLAAHAVFDRTGSDDLLCTLHATIGHPTQANAPLLRVRMQARVSDVAAAQALGVEVAKMLHEAGAAAYLRACE
jgi:hydroxymethylbilane synthase